MHVNNISSSLISRNTRPQSPQHEGGGEAGRLFEGCKQSNGSNSAKSEAGESITKVASLVNGKVLATKLTINDKDGNFFELNIPENAENLSDIPGIGLWNIFKDGTLSLMPPSTPLSDFNSMVRDGEIKVTGCISRLAQTLYRVKEGAIIEKLTINEHKIACINYMGTLDGDGFRDDYKYKGRRVFFIRPFDNFNPSVLIPSDQETTDVTIASVDAAWAGVTNTMMVCMSRSGFILPPTDLS